MKRIILFVRSKTWIWLIASLTLGLAPFTPEPHLWGKIKWIWGGAVGMQPMDWFDFFLHATPWFILFISLGLRLFIKNPKAGESNMR